MMKVMRLTALAIALCAAPAIAQEVREGPGMSYPQDNPAGRPRREQMEQRLRQGLWRIAKQRVGFTDAQMTKLTEVSHRYDARRRTVNQEERAQRQTLRTELVAGTSANQDRIASAMDRLLQLQRQRLDITGDEQKEFASFMTPFQRAQYAALQEQLRRRVEELRRARADSSTAGPRRKGIGRPG